MIPDPERSYSPGAPVTIALSLSCAASILCVVTQVSLSCKQRRLSRHPAPLLLCRAVFDAFFCISCLTSHILRVIQADTASDSNVCAALAFTTQACALAAELYTGLLGWDLLASLRNPFMHYRGAVRRYHAVVVLCAGVSAVLLVALRPRPMPLFGRDNYLSMCWVHMVSDTGQVDASVIAFFIAPLLLIYAFTSIVLVYASRRLRQGLPETFEARLSVYRTSLRISLCYVMYWAAAVGIYVVITLVDSKAPPDFVSLLLAFALGSRGIVTAVVWLLTFAKNLTCSRRGCRMIAPATASQKEERDGLDLRPHLSIALRREILYYTTLGIAKSIARAHKSTQPAVDGELGRYGVRYNVLMLSRKKERTGLFKLERQRAGSTSSATTTSDNSMMANNSSKAHSTINSPAMTREISMKEPNVLTTPLIAADGLPDLEAAPVQPAEGDDQQRGTRSSCCWRSSKLEEFRFIDYEPFLFQRLRSQAGISDEEYVRSLGKTRREKFSEGASGAFLYFSSDEQFIVKTLTASEADVLLAMLHDYITYLSSHPHSLVTRFYGLHSVTMYGQTMHFAVMSNVLKTGGNTLHERYDIKGSWVGRSRAPLERGMRTDCRYCGQKFRVGDRSEGASCPSRPNQFHEPNTVLKDNDLIYKLRLSPEVAQALGDQISADSEFLRRHGITDYSLLLGVHRTKYKLVSSSSSMPDLNRQSSFTHGRQAAHSRGVGGIASPSHRAREPSSWGIDVAPQDLLGSPVPAKAAAFLSDSFALESTAPSAHHAKSASIVTDEEDAAAGVFAEQPDVTKVHQLSVNSTTEMGKRARAPSPLLWNRPSSVGDAGIGEEAPPKPALFWNYRGGLRATVVEGPGIYYCGIIDILQRYTWAKWIERQFKTSVMLQNPRGVSAMPPDEYAGRFRRRVIEQLIDGYEFSELPGDDDFYAAPHLQQP